MRAKLLFSAMSLGLLSSCIMAPEPASPFDPQEAAFIHEDGENTIRGEAFLRKESGGVVYAAGSSVRLIPKTAYAAERLDALYRGGKINTIISASPPPPDYEAAMRQTKANGRGRFEFDHVADGSYYIVTKIKWGKHNAEGGAIREAVTVSGGQSVEIIMDGR
ncbi:carboxypeptidase regulatory-like domain-containing protein [Martelella sp. HB161492]|uniref:carboxypeptidase regulatory-like domain-containing protein n=1 Tax=Martelella sp. HB161492 TaxID=2720726 RepID=UPI001590ADF1|nr:carboxypeptidase regulatory-like domain-containing protein [Martelella sp. HB161492]